MQRNKKLAKRIGCGLLAGTLVASSFVPFSNNTLVAKASSSLLTKDNKISANDNITYTTASGEVYALYSSACEYIKTKTDIMDDFGNYYSGDVVKLVYRSSNSLLKEQYCIVNLQCANKAKEGGTEAVVPRTVNEKVNGETVALPVIELGVGAFKNSTYSTIKIPDTVVKIADSAFQDSKNLEEVIYTNQDGTTNSGKYLQEIGSFAFSGCSKLKKAVIPAKLLEAKMDNKGNLAENTRKNGFIGNNKKIGNEVFAECTSLTEVTIGDRNSKNIEIPDAMFLGCTALKSIKFGENIQKAILGSCCFARLDQLRSITFDFAVFARSYALVNNKNLEEITFRSDVSAAASAFSNNTSLLNVTFHGSLSENREGNSGETVGLFQNSFSTNAMNTPKVTFTGRTKDTDTNQGVYVTLPPYCFKDAIGLKKVEFANQIASVQIREYAFEKTGIEELNFDGADVTVYPYGLAKLGSHTKSVAFNNSGKTILHPESFLETSTNKNEVQILDNIDLQKIVLNSKNVDFSDDDCKAQRHSDIFAGVGKNCELYFGKKVEKVSGQIADHQNTEPEFTFEKCNGLGNIKKIYITNPNTKQANGEVFAADNNCTIYGYANCQLFAATETQIKEKKYKKLKIDSYVSMLAVSEKNDKKIEFENKKGFDESKVCVVAYLEDGGYEVLNYSPGGINGYDLTDESKLLIEQSYGAREEKEIYIVFEYENAHKGIKVTMVPRRIAEFSASKKKDVTFVEGTKPNKEDFILSNFKYNDDTEENAEVNPYEVSVRVDSKTGTFEIGENTVIVTYKGVEEKIYVQAEKKAVAKLTVKLTDETKKYYPGTVLTDDDFEVTVEYNNGEVKKNFENYAVSANTIPTNVTAGTPFVIKISAENARTEIALPISKMDITSLTASYKGVGVVEGSVVDKKDITVLAVYEDGKKQELKPEEYTLEYEPIQAEKKNTVKIVLKADITKTANVEVNGLKRTADNPVESPVPTKTPNVLPTIAPTVMPTTPSVTPVETVNPTEPVITPTSEPIKPENTPIQTATPIPSGTVVTTPNATTSSPSPILTPTTTPSILPVITPPVPTIVPIETVEPGSVPNTGVTKLKANKYTLGVKEKATISLTGGKAVKFATSDKKIATVSQKGEIKAVKTGTVNIKVTDEFGAVKTVKVTVKKAPKSVKATVKSRTLHVGKKVTIKAKFTKGYYSNKLTYTSSNKKVATVSKTGVILAKKKGKTTITVKTYNGKKAKVTISVK